MARRGKRGNPGRSSTAGGTAATREPAAGVRQTTVQEHEATTEAGPPATAATAPGTDPSERRLQERGVIRAGVYAWAVLGLLGIATLLVLVAGELALIVVPFVLALFPAALLQPVSRWLVRRRVPPALAALGTMLGALVVITGTFALLAPAVAAEIPGLVGEIEDGIEQLETFFEEGVLGWEPPLTLPEALALVQEQALQFLQEQGVGIAGAVAEGVAGLLFGLVALFFYLKDGERIARWLNSLFPARQQAAVHDASLTGWTTIGQYFRGQLLVALFDAVFIGFGLLLLGVPLVLPLAVLVFFAGLFPIVGAIASGTVAVLVALASEGVGVALGVLAVVVVVQQVESNVLAPVVLGRATALHPLGVLISLSVGGVVLGVLGAFLAVPVAASIVKGVGVFRRHFPPADAVAEPKGAPRGG